MKCICTILSIADVCKCAGISNEYNEGSVCKKYSGYEDEWYNGRWCYAKFATCSDAREHPDAGVLGFGASRIACKSGKLNIWSIYKLQHKDDYN